MFIVRRGGLIAFAIAAAFAVTLFAGVRYGAMLAIGLGFGLILEGLRFGFAGPWRALILKRDASGALGQLLAIAIAAVIAIPLLEVRPEELTGAGAPIGLAMVFGAFLFGIAMQVVLACGSGTLVNAGSGNLLSLAALPFFAIGSFFGAYHLIWWTKLGSLPVHNLTGWSGVGLTLAGLAAVAAVMLWRSAPEHRRLPRRYVIAAALLACLAILNLVAAGQPWGVVYGLGLWVAKGATTAGADLSGSAFWSAGASVERVEASILTDYTSLTNIGIMLGAFLVVCWRRGGLSQKVPKFPAKAWLAAMVSGFVLGYCARLAFGCNVGAFFSGISTGSLHGWVWFAAAFCGAFIGVRLRPALGLEPRQ